MSAETIIFFVLALMVWGLSVGARWLQEQMGKNSTDGMEFEPIDWSSSAELEAVAKGEGFVPPDQPQQPSLSTSDRSRMVGQKKSVRRFGLGSPQTLRHGIILMTVLGPCRALELPNNSKPF